MRLRTWWSAGLVADDHEPFDEVRPSPEIRRSVPRLPVAAAPLRGVERARVTVLLCPVPATECKRRCHMDPTVHRVAGVVLGRALFVACAGFGWQLTGWWLERRYVHFEPDDWED